MYTYEYATRLIVQNNEIGKASTNQDEARSIMFVTGFMSGLIYAGQPTDSIEFINTIHTLELAVASALLHRIETHV